MKIKSYDNINWLRARKELLVNQEKLVEAYRSKNNEAVVEMQSLITYSFAARCLAVREVVSTKGGKTSGVDGILLDSSPKRWSAIQKLKFITEHPKEYIASPVKRVMIPKGIGSSEKRPLGIPTLIDRCLQRLYLYSIDPIIEEKSDHKSFGFRKYRNAHHAIVKIRHLLEKDSSPRYILDADIEKCFDKILHGFLLKHTPILHSSILESWLNSGILVNGIFYESTEGVPQGGVISPLLCNVALNGLEDVVKEKGEEIYRSIREKGDKTLSKLHVVRFADDFIVTGSSSRLIQEVKPVIEEFLSKRGLRLHPKKTKLIMTDEGFDFLGYTVLRRNYNPRLNNLSKSKTRILILPSSKSRAKFLEMIKTGIDKSKPIESIIRELNPKIRGWGNYFRISYHSTRCYKVLADLVWHKMWRWAKTKHKGRNAEWIFLKYTRESKWRTRHWGTSEMLLQDLSTMTPLKIFHMPTGLNPYVEEERKVLELRIWKDYKGDEDGTLREKVLRAQGGHCLCCGSPILGSEEEIELHHILSILEGGTWSYKNLCLLHETCHKQVTKNKLLNKKIAHRRKIGKDWITF